MAGLFGAPSQSLFSGGWNAPTDGGLGALSKEDRLMALFAGLSQAGARMAQPGLSRGQQIAAGFGGIGQGMAEANQAALIQKLTGLKLGELKRKTEQEQKQQTAVDRLAMGFRTGGASGADMLRAGGPQGGTAPNAALADIVEASPEIGLKYAAERMMPKALNPKDQTVEIAGKLYNIADLKNPTLLVDANRPQQALGQLLEEQKKHAPDSPQWRLYQSQIAKIGTDNGFRFNADGSMAPAQGGPADLGYVGRRAGTEAMAKVPAAVATAAQTAPIDVAKAEAMPANLEPGASRFRGDMSSLLRLLPNYRDGIPANVPRIGDPPRQPAPAPQAAPPAPVMPPPGAAPVPPVQTAPLPAPPPAGPQPIATNSTQMWQPDPNNPRVQVSITGERKDMPGAKEQEEDKRRSEMALFDTDRTIKTVDDLLNHPGRLMATGKSSVIPAIPGTDAYGFATKLETLQSQLFVPEVQKMVGMGALSNAEGLKLVAAVGALKPGMPEAEFEASLKGVLNDLKAARERFAARAGRTASDAPPSSLPGNPADLSKLSDDDVLKRLGIR